MRDGMTARDPVVFTSWKEIASYLGKGVRTVQRWEAQFGLPVQRPNAHAKGIVRATREELDHWIATRWSARQGGSDPDGGSFGVPSFVRANAELNTYHELRMRNLALLRGLHESLEKLKNNCQDLVVNLAFGRELDLKTKRFATTKKESAESPFAPQYPASGQASAD